MFLPKVIPLFLLWFSSVAQSSLIWLDCDPSVGQHEVDDGYALLQGFKSHITTIVGVSAVYGNAPLSVTLPTAQKIVDALSNGTMKVFRGAESRDDYTSSTDASVAIVEALSMWCEEKIIIIALGPLTNIAAALSQNSSIAQCIKEVISVSGRRPGQKFTINNASNHLRDLNFDLDPFSYAVVINSTVALTLIPWEVSSQVWLLRSDLEGIHSSDPYVQWLVEASLEWCLHWRGRFGVDGFNPFDSLAVAFVTTPSIFGCDHYPITVFNSSSSCQVAQSEPTGSIYDLELHVLDYKENATHTLTTNMGDTTFPLPSRHSVKYCHSVHSGYSRALLDILRGYQTVITVINASDEVVTSQARMKKDLV